MRYFISHVLGQTEILITRVGTNPLIASAVQDVVTGTYMVAQLSPTKWKIFIVNICIV